MAKPTTLLIRLRAPDQPLAWLSLDARGSVLAGPRSGERPVAQRPFPSMMIATWRGASNGWASVSGIRKILRR